MKKSKVLIVDDDKLILELFESCLSEFGFLIHTISDSSEAIEIMKQESFDLVFLDIHMKPIDGFTILAEIKKKSHEAVVIIISGFEDYANALKAIDLGAYHILRKPVSMQELLFFTKKAIEYHDIRAELKKIKEKFYNIELSGNITTQNPDFIKNLDLAETVADSNISVLIRGESGTGKELMAEFIHEKSSRSNNPFVKVNCAAIPGGLLESELFGHVKGAFTGANKDRKGRFELAHGGTLFLDEIGEMPVAFQSKLLRVLQSGEFESVGDTKTKKVNVRIISATNINIEAAIQEKTFREDLFYRLNGVTIKIPALRDRPEDIELLVQHFIKKFFKNKQIQISDAALFILKSHSWRGNVRELENIIHRSALIAKENLIDIIHLPEEIRNPSQGSTDTFLSLEEVEEIHIKKVLASNPDFKEASRILKIDQATLWRKRKRYSI